MTGHKIMAVSVGTQKAPALIYGAKNGRLVVLRDKQNVDVWLKAPRFSQ